MIRLLQTGLHHSNGFVRKGCILALQGPKRWAALRADPQAFFDAPPVIANSFPKSGTHLLDQLVAGLPGRANFGEFISSMTSSFQMREMSVESACQRLRRIVPGELVRAHLFHDDRYAAELTAKNAVHFFIFRDPRDVIVSDCHYLRDINRWHRLHPHFRACANMEEAILLSIRGMRRQDPSVPLPDVAARFAAYEGWLHDPTALAVRFEDLRGANQAEHVARMVDFFAARCEQPLDRAATVAAMLAQVDPAKSHTFRQGGKGGWAAAFTPTCKDAFKEVAGDLLVRLGYETGDAW